MHFRTHGFIHSFVSLPRRRGVAVHDVGFPIPMSARELWRFIDDTDDVYEDAKSSSYDTYDASGEGNEVEILMIQNLLSKTTDGVRADEDAEDEDEDEDDVADVRVKMEKYASGCEKHAEGVVRRLRRARGRALRDVEARLSGIDDDDDGDDSVVEMAVRGSEEILKSFHRGGVDNDDDDDASDVSSCEGEDVKRARRLVALARAWSDARDALRDARAKRDAEERDAALNRAETEVRDALKTLDFARAARGTRVALDVATGRDVDADDADVVLARAEGVASAFRQCVEREARESFVVDRANKSIVIDAKRFAQSCEHLHFVGPDETRERLRETSNALVEEFLKPMILAGASETIRVVVSSDDSSHLRYETTTTTTTDTTADDESAQAALEDALRWLRARLPNDKVADAVGREFWARVASACVAAWLSKDTDERAVDRTCAVEAVASSCGFVPPPPDGSASYAGGALGPLEAEALATEMSQAETRRAEVLARARELAMNDDASLMRTAANEHGGERFGVGRGTGDESGVSRGPRLLDCAPCTVSAAADALTEHVDRVLESACELGPHAHRASANLAAAAADCLDLFRACVTATRAERLRSIHTSAVVFYNDCHHLANRFCASVYARGPALKRQIGREPALLWPVEPLRALGDATRSDANERALEELHAALDVADGFLRSGEAQVKANIAKSIARARHVIHRAGTVSMYALPHPLGTQDAAELALHYARRVALEVLSIEDISVEESEALTELLGAAFATDGLVGAKGDTTASRALVDAVGTEWFKARELGLMLSAPLRDITADWERGRLRALGFSSEELRGLIGALFSETSLRAECLARIQ